MRDRHFPRACRSCQAPMARQESMCRHCGAQWASEDAPPTRLHAITGGALTQGAGEPRPGVLVAVAGAARAATDERLDTERWTNEGGSFDFEVAVPLRAAGGRR
jgi:hypothetical protein